MLNTENTLDLESLYFKPEDSGENIACQVKIKDDPKAGTFKAKIDFDLQFAPETQNYKINYNMINDQNTLAIELWANPKPFEAIWTVNAQEYNILSSSITKIREGKWSIVLPSGVQSSEYTLKVANTYGKAEYIFKNFYSAKSILPAPTKLSLEINDQNVSDSYLVNLNEKLEITAKCIAENPKCPLEYTWYFGGKRVEYAVASTVTLKVNPQDSGKTLECEISYTHDHKMEQNQIKGRTYIDTVLNVRYNPTIFLTFGGKKLLKDQKLELNLDENTCLVLNCHMEKYLGSAEFQWLFGGIPKDNGRTLPQYTDVFETTLQISDQGKEIKCQVGDHEAKIYLDLQFKPKSKEITERKVPKKYNEYTSVSLTFNANPEPLNATWIIGNILVPSNKSVNDFNSTAITKIRDTPNEYKIQLKLQLTPEICGKIFYLNVTNEIGMTTYEWKLDTFEIKVSSTVTICSIVIVVFIVFIVYMVVFRNGGVTQAVSTVASFVANRCSEIKDFYTNEALEKERSRPSGVFSLHMQKSFDDQHYFHYDPNSDIEDCEPENMSGLSVGQFEEVSLQDK